MSQNYSDQMSQEMCFQIPDIRRLAALLPKWVFHV